MEKIGLLGSGGQADEAYAFAKGKSEVDFYAIDAQYLDDSEKNQINILSPSEYQKTLPVVAAIGAPAIRKEMVEKWSGESYSTIIAEQAYVDESAKVGEGGIVAPRAVITTNVEIGGHSIINVNSSISHDCKLGDYVTVSPGAHIAGNVVVGDGVFVGIGAIISNGLFIAEGSVIGAGAVVLKDITEPNSVVVGTPAKVVNKNEGWLREI